MVYSTFLSYLTLLQIVNLNRNIGSLEFSIFSDSSFKGRSIFILFISTFLIKVPIIFLHFWLPKVHVEAPVEGSIFLARILIKLGPYALIILISIFYKQINIWSSFFTTMSLLGIIIIGVVCCWLKDSKKIVAFSSIVHINFLIIVIFSLKTFLLSSSIVVMVSHGIVSPILFKFIDLKSTFTGSRIIDFIKGYFNFKWFLLWFLTCLWNISCPPSINILAEIILFFILITVNFYYIIFLIIRGLWVSFYNVRLIICVFGEKKKIRAIFNMKTIIYLYFLPFVFLNLNFLIFNEVLVI